MKRSSGRPVKIDPSQHPEVVRLYESGLSMEAVGREFDVSATKIFTVLASEGVERRSQGSYTGNRGATKKIHPHQHAEIVRLYESGMSLTAIGERFRVSMMPISRVLREEGVVVRKPGEIRGKPPSVLEPSQYEEIIHLYGLGLSMREVGEKFGVTPMPIRNVLYSHGVKIRRKGWTKQLDSYAERDARVVESYKTGKSMEDVGRQFGISRERVRQVLRRSGYQGVNTYKGRQFVERIETKCEYCGKTIFRVPSKVHLKFCSKMCMNFGTENPEGKKAYRMREEGLIWREIQEALGLSNACQTARLWAFRHGEPWPIEPDAGETNEE